jgi:hypothetical protein
MRQFTSSKRALRTIGPMSGSGRLKAHDKHRSAVEEPCKFILSMICT